MKKIAVACLILGTNSVFSGSMGALCEHGNVSVPCESSGWAVGGQALYLHFSDENPRASQIGTTANPYASYKSNDRWGWGFRFEGEYYYGTGNDVDLNWSHYNTSASTIYANTLVGPTTLRVFNDTPRGKQQARWDQVNMEFAQRVDFSQTNRARFHADIEYSYLHFDEAVWSTAAPLVDLLNYTNRINSFNGVGPRLGADLNHLFSSGLSVYGAGAISLLAGQTKFTRSSIIYSTNSLASGTFNRVVPEMEAKLGASYSYSMLQGNLSAELGWMWVNYFNVYEYGFTNGSATRLDNFALQGPYIGLKWNGNA